MRAPVQRLASLAFACLLHVLCLWVLISPFKREQATTTIAAPPPPKPAVRSASELPQRADDADAHVPKPSSLRVYGYDFDLRKVRARWRDLFPFVTTSLSLQSVASMPHADGGLIFADPATLPRPLPPAPPMLAMSDAAIQQLTDRTWSRRDRWTHFADYVKLATAYHPDRGRLSSALRAYIEQNALQPYADTSFPDPRRWAMLALAADHRDFIDFAVPYVREHPSTRTSTELLFLLDQLAQGSRDAFVLLLETKPRQLAWTHEENPQAYLLFDTLHEYYTDVARERGLSSIDAVNRKYEDVRLQLLSTIVRQTEAEHRKWVDFSFDRLARFGYGFDRF